MEIRLAVTRPVIGSGTVLAAVGLGAVTFGLTRAGDVGFNGSVLAACGAGAACLSDGSLSAGSRGGRAG